MELFKASNQWSTRPADERFESLRALYEQCKAYHATAGEKDVPFEALRVEASSNEVVLVGKASVPARLTHWAFGQLAGHVGAPASYLRELPATLACQNLNHGLARRVKDHVGSATAKLLFHTNGSLLLRAITSDQYSRIWNYEIAERLLDAEAKGWTAAKPMMAWGRDPKVCIVCDGTGKLSYSDAADITHGTYPPCKHCKGTGRALPALYASDHDLFAFVVNLNSTIQEAGSEEPLYRGMIWENSEVGASKLRGTKFLFRTICGNHIIWGARNVVEIELRHVGGVRDKYASFAAKMTEFANESASEDEAEIKRLQTKLIAGSKAEVLDALFGKRAIGLSRRTLEQGYDAVTEQDGNPNSVWGMAQGLTRFSQTIPFADKRTEVDRAAGRVLVNF